MNPLCEECERSGIVTASVDVAHIVPVRDGGAVFDDDNTRCLCHPCHSRESAERGERWGR